MMSAWNLLPRWLPRHPGRAITPDLERFLQWLAETPYSWQLQADGRLRASDGGAVLCAVTAVARHRQALAFSVGDWVRAGASLGLSYATAGLIVDAADGRAVAALEALRSAGVAIRTFELRKPTLEEIFLSVVRGTR